MLHFASTPRPAGYVVYSVISHRCDSILSLQKQQHIMTLLLGNSAWLVVKGLVVLVNQFPRPLVPLLTLNGGVCNQNDHRVQYECTGPGYSKLFTTRLRLECWGQRENKGCQTDSVHGLIPTQIMNEWNQHQINCAWLTGSQALTGQGYF